MRRWFTHAALGAMMALTAAAVSATAAHADPRDFTLNNGSGFVIEQVYVSSSAIMNWEEDVLGQDVLMPGDSVNITFTRFTDGDCLYDIKVVADTGDEGQLNQVNLCEVTDVTFN